MPAPWSSLFCPSDRIDAIAGALRDALTAQGYTLYNPFGALPGKAYPHSIRLFVCPPQNGWVRVVGEADPSLSFSLSQHHPVLSLRLERDQATIAVYAEGATRDPVEALRPWFRPGVGADQVRHALTNPTAITADSSTSTMPMDALPSDVQRLASRVNPAQANKLFGRISGDLLKKVSGDAGEAAAARAMVNGSDAPDWNSAGGRRIRGLMACLTVPEGWQTPDFVTLRDAYQLHERRQRNPRARLYPGDEAVMASVMDALAHIPIYGGAD